jgi:hypothetical protein
MFRDQLVGLCVTDTKAVDLAIRGHHLLRPQQSIPIELRFGAKPLIGCRFDGFKRHDAWGKTIGLRGRVSLLSATAFSGAFWLLLFSTPHSAIAACTVTATGTVDCSGTFASTNTTNTNGAVANSTNYFQVFNNVVNITADTQLGTAISVYGLSLTQGTAAGTVTMNNQGTVSSQNFDGLAIYGNGGLVTYSGNGSAITTVAAVSPSGFYAGLAISNTNSGGVNIGSMASPITGNFFGQHGIYVGTPVGIPNLFNGNQNIFLLGGTVTETGGGPIGAAAVGIFGDTRTGTGNVFIQTTGNTTIASTTTGGIGIAAETLSGNSTIITDANIGTSGAPLGGGIRAAITSGAGQINLSQTGGAIFSNNLGISAVNGGIGSIAVTTKVGSAITMAGGTGIDANESGSGGNVLVVANGTINGAATTGINAQITNAANISNISVTTQGNVSGATGINAASTGTGAISVTTLAGTTVTGFSGPAITAQSSGGQINLTNNGTLLTNLPTSAVIQTNGGLATLSNSGSITGALALSGGGVFNNNSGGIWTTSGVNSISGGLTNTGTVNVNGGAINGAITNGAGGALYVTGAVTSNNVFNNSAATSNLTINPGSSYTISGGLTNMGTVNANGGAINGAITNGAGGAFYVTGSVTSDNMFNNSAATSNLTINPGSSYAIAGALANNGTIKVLGTSTLTAGSYVGAPGSQLFVNVDPLHQTAGKLVITGNASGSTVVNANYLSQGSLTSPIPIVQAGSGATTFTLANPNNGLFSYVLNQGSLASTLSSTGVASGVISRTATGTSQLTITEIEQQLEGRRDQIQSRFSSQTGRPMGYAGDGAVTYQDDVFSYQDRTSKKNPATDALAMAVKAPRAPDDSGPKPALWAQAFDDWERRDEASAGVDFGRKSNTYGFQMGFDETWRNLVSSSDALVVGIVGGDSRANVTFAANDMRVNLNGPGLGLYGTYIAGGFSIDSVVKGDWFNMTEVDPVAGVSNSVNLQNFNVAGNVQYKFDVAKGSFIEPTAGATYTRTTYGSGAAALNLEDGHVVRLQSGARFGTAWDWNNIHLEPTLLAVVYSDVIITGTAVQNIGIVAPNDQGLVRGEFDLEMHADFGQGISAFAQGDVRFGQGLLGEALKVGARKQW